MIIVEGMDGTGKTSLIRHLSEQMNLPVHERHCTSSGPKEDLFEWAKKDVLTWKDQPFSIYDRHPFVSEYIYGPITRGWIDPRFHTPEARQLVKDFAFNCVILFCDPGLHNIVKNVQSGYQMSGVDEHTHELALMYRSFFTLWPTPLRVARWDYSSPTPGRDYDAIQNIIRAQAVAHERLTNAE